MPQERSARFRLITVGDTTPADHALDVAAIRVRAGEVHGPYQSPDAALPAMILAALEGSALPPLGDIDTPRDWLHVDDLVAALWAIAGNGTPGARYRVAVEPPSATSAVARRIVELVRRHASVHPGIGRLLAFAHTSAGDTQPAAGATSALVRDTGWAPELSLEQGLSATVRWYLANETWARHRQQARAAGLQLGLLRSA